MDKSIKLSGGHTLGLLGIAFVVLKLIGVIDWSWWWVTSPFWGGFALLVLIIIIALIADLISNLFSKRS